MFLFAYYKIDLERDLKRNNREAMDLLVNTMIKNDNTSRTYMLVKHTSDAVRLNTRGCKIRIRRYLRLIDKYFWERQLQSNSQNRLIRQLNNWMQDSSEFSIELNKRKNIDSVNKSKKDFVKPYLKCDFSNSTFRLILPSQLIRINEIGALWWKISIGSRVVCLKVELNEAVTGYKTQEQSVEVYGEEIFQI
ncbi:MAG: hypothetical protein ACOX1Y_06030 [Zhaonellaceae bacterium]